MRENMSMIIHNCWRCGKIIDTSNGENYYSLNAIEWKGCIGKTIGNVFLCGKCADGVDEYLDELYKKNELGDMR